MTDAIVAWDPRSPQWLEILAAARGAGVADPRRADILWRVYGPLLEAQVRNMPFAIGQAGQSLDGRIATASGDSHYINGDAALIHLHRLRALVDAVVVGAGTVASDDPQLTVRRVEGPSPARVVIDPTGRAPPTARFFAADGVRRIVVCRQAPDRPRELSLPESPQKTEYLVLADLTPTAILAALRAAGLARVLVEGGAKTLSGFVAGRALDRLHVMIAPLIVGSGPAGLTLPEIATLDQAQRPMTASYPLPGGDVLFDCDLRAVPS